MNCKCGFANNIEGVTLKCKQCGEPLITKPGGGIQRGDSRFQQREHVLEAAGAPPFVLTPGTDVLIGRGTECALSIPSNRVSRQHARITWRDGLPVLAHMSENNPTLVNGQVVKTHELREGDELQIGPWRCNYRSRGAAAGKAADTAGGLTVADQGAALVGSLAVFSLVELLRDYERQKSTGTLSLTGSDQDGFLVFEDGNFISAELGALTGEEAAFVLLTWDEGMFSFSTEKRGATKKIFRTFDYSAVGPSKQKVQKITISTLLARAAEKNPALVKGPAAATARLSPKAEPPPASATPPRAPSGRVASPPPGGGPPRPGAPRPPGPAGGPPPAPKPRPGPGQPPGR